MSYMCGSEIARLVLGYLQSQRMDKVALEFSKLSPYLREEYGALKRGLKIRQASNPRKLLDIFREFIEVEETVNEFIDNEFKRYERIPKELLQLQTLKDKVKYACRMFRTAEDTQNQCTTSRKRSNVSIIECEYDSDSEATSHSSPRATNIQDLPGYSRPPLKRRKLYDPTLRLSAISSKSDVVCLDDIVADRSKSTPLKLSDTSQDPSSSKHLQKSASKVMIPPEILSKSMLASDIPNVLAKSINEAFDNNVSTVQLTNKMPDIWQSTSSYLTFEDIIAEVCPESYEDQSMQSSSAASKPASELEYDPEKAKKRSLDTPVPNNESRRYELRSTKKTTPALNTSTESKPKKNAKVHIVSDVILPPITIDSDSEGTVTTTSQQQQSQQQNMLYYDPQLQSLFLIKPNLVDTQSQPTTSTATIFGNPIQASNAVDQSCNAFPTDNSILNLDNFTIINSNAVQSNPIVISDVSQTDAVSNGDDNRSRFIVINNDDVQQEGKRPIENTQLEQTVHREATTENNEKLTESLKDVEQKQAVATGALDDKQVALRQLKQIAEPKVVTPKQLIKSNIPNSARSLSTPRNKNPHVRVLDFNTPSRFRMSEIDENKGDSISNKSRFFSETPQNRSITSSMPSSAPPKVNSVTQTVKRSENTLESEPFVPDDENTVVSAEGETPKVRKTNRKSVRRTISAQKEIDPEENKKRMKRVALTKKKICSDDDGDCDTAKKDAKIEVPISSEDAAAEWERLRMVKKNPELFEQYVREENSKKQQREMPTGRKRRVKRTKKTPVVKSKPIIKAQSNKLDDITKSVDVSMNSTLDPDILNSTATSLEARMLEENLKSAKKVTPVKPTVAPKSAKKKMQSKVQIKLMPSPKNKAAKRLKNKKDPNSIPVNNLNQADKNDAIVAEAQNEAPAEVQNKVIEPAEMGEVHKTNENTTDDLEVAQNLLSMQEMILKQENQRKLAQTNELQSDSVVVSQVSAVAVPICKTTSEPIALNNRIDAEALRNIHQPNSSMSALLETPYKDGTPMFPKTPCIGNILPQLVTPLLRPCESLMDDSIFKNPQFPTPSFPITPGSIFTPFKDILSPRSDQEVVYGAVNRPTDYSSSSSYYKPDESDGIDKQIQASIQSARTNSGDENEDHSKTENITQNTLNTSSSSSSSSDSDSDTDSDSSSSSDSDASRASNKSSHKSPDKSPLKPSKPEPIDEDSTQIIKSHLVSTNEMNIAKNILLSEPEEPMKSEEAMRLSVLEEKRRRMQESLREIEMKNKPKQTKKLNENKRKNLMPEREHIRGPSAVVSQSRRKSTPPKKFVSVHNRQIYSQINVVPAEKRIEIEVKSKTVTTERLITEAAGDNAIVDASDVSTTQILAAPEEESVEAIKSHMNKSTESDDVQPIAKGAVANLSPEGLIDMLSEKQRRFDANKPKTKTEVIDALPMPRTTRSRAKNAKIAAAQHIIGKSTATTSNLRSSASSNTRSAKTTNKADSSKGKRKLNSSAERMEKVAKQTNIETAKTAPAKSVATVSSKSNDEFITPAKEKQARQIRDIFGDCTDIETPIKSPSKVVTKPNSTESKPQATENKCNKFEADSSNVQDSDEGDDSSSEDEYEYEMIFSIDETDKRRFVTLRENGLSKSKETFEPVIIGRKNVVMECGTVVLEPTDEIELFTQDIHSVAKMKKDRRRTTKETKTEASNEPTSSSEEIYDKPLHTSTPSPNKKFLPKFNIKHKLSDNVSPKSAKKQSPSEFFNDIVVDDVLVQLHPGTTG